MELIRFRAVTIVFKGVISWVVFKWPSRSVHSVYRWGTRNQCCCIVQLYDTCRWHNLLSGSGCEVIVAAPTGLCPQYTHTHTHTHTHTNTRNLVIVHVQVLLHALWSLGCSQQCWWLKSSETWRRIYWYIITRISEEHAAFVFRSNLFRWMLKWWWKNVTVCEKHVYFSTPHDFIFHLNPFSHPEDGSSTFLRNLVTNTTNTL